MKNPLWFFSSINTRHPSKWEGIVSRIHVDMGCGRSPRNPFNADVLIGIDILNIEKVHIRHFRYQKIEIGGNLPLESNSIDSMSGFDFIEHLGRGPSLESNLFIRFMNEAFRVLKPSGVLLLVTPAFPSPAAFQDPTHLNYITIDTVRYFVGRNAGVLNKDYGFEGNFILRHQEWVGPFTKIWDSKISIESNSLPNIEMNPDSNFSRRITSLRRIISNIRKPTHLLWLLEKPNNHDQLHIMF